MPKDWSDLWRPELQGHISLLDQPREVIGLTLKKLGKSYNTEKLSEVPSLEEELSKLHQQVKYYSSNKYLEPLILGDTWLALGWSTDVLSVRSSNRQIEAIVPLSGTAIWADVWVQPASVSDNSKPPAGPKANTSLTKDWINFCWQPQSAEKISILSNATSPIFFDDDSKTLPKALQDNPLLLPDSSVLDKSEFLKPLPKEVSQEYEALWKKIRNVRHS
jgi:putative spermidine/putrescine transport system substrate-binding protein